MRLGISSCNLQTKALYQLVIDLNSQLGFAGLTRRGVAEAQVHRQALVFPDEQVAGQIERDADRFAHQTTDLQRLPGPHQFAQPNESSGGGQARAVMGLSGQRKPNSAAFDALTGQHDLIQHQGLHGGAQLVGIAALDQQQLDAGIPRVGDHRQGRVLDVGQRQTVEVVAVDREHDPMSIWQRCDADREAGAAVIRSRPEPARQHGRLSPQFRRIVVERVIAEAGRRTGC